MTIKYFPVRKALSRILAILAVFFFSCSSGNGTQNSTKTADSPAVVLKPEYDHSFAAGKVIDSVVCKKQTGQSYALYLPTYYTPDKKYPCIYFFDAHARGSLPLRSYEDLAEKYGFVLIGSNVSKNGTPWPVTNEGVVTLMNDSRSRINIDPKRIYTSGFSGGSRVASSIAIFNGGIAGVIGCAAGFPQVEHDIHNKFDYFGIVGDRDFNLVEMEQLDIALAQNGFAHQLLTCDNIHGWPSKADFQTAILWIQVSAMKQNLALKNDTLINMLKEDLDKRSVASMRSGDIIRTNDLLEGISRVLDGLTDVFAYKNRSAAMVSGDNYKKAIADQKQLQGIELQQQQELSAQFTLHDEKWWSKKIADLDQKATGTGNRQDALLNARLVNYLGLVSYMHTTHALNIGDLHNAETYLKIFKLADPKNPDCSYLSAIFHMKTGDQQKAITALNESVALGYSDISQLISEPVFNDLKNDVAFKNIVEMVRANYTSK